MKNTVIIVGRNGGQKGASHEGIGSLMSEVYLKLQQAGFEVFYDEQTLRDFQIANLKDWVQEDLGEIYVRRLGFAGKSVEGPLYKTFEQTYTVLVFGGDGTMLGACKKYASLDAEFLGINQGRVGFITDLPHDVTPDLVTSLLVDRLEDPTAHSEHRSMIQAVLENKYLTASGEVNSRGHLGIALNDVTVTRRDGRMIEFSVFIDDRFAYRARGDGLLMATPTGSTAYALSAGGSIIEPGTPVFELLVMMPQSLSHRPLIFDDRKQVTIELHVGEAQIYVDGNTVGELTAGSKLTLRSSAQKIKFIHPQNHDYLNTLREKLNWQLPPGRQ